MLCTEDINYAAEAMKRYGIDYRFERFEQYGDNVEKLIVSFIKCLAITYYNAKDNAKSVAADYLRKFSKSMEEKLNFTQLLQKPIAMMTGEELCFLITKSVESTEAATPQVASKGNYYGIEGIARVFGCSVPTANRIKKSGIIDKAITQIGRKIVVDADLALSLAKESGDIHIKE